jgi:class I fructose-bisphosphate aldolase
MGAHIIKVKLPSEHIEQDPARKVYEAEKIPVKTVADRVRHIVQSAFNGRRIVIFSGGSKRGDEALFDDIRAIRDGGGFGSIIGRNSFQRPRDDAIKFLHTIMDIYSGTID